MFWLVALHLTLECDIYCLGASAEIKVKMVYLTSGYIKSKFEFKNPGFTIIWICEYLCILSWTTWNLKFVFCFLFNYMCIWMKSSQGKQNLPKVEKFYCLFLTKRYSEEALNTASGCRQENYRTISTSFFNSIVFFSSKIELCSKWKK